MFIVNASLVAGLPFERLTPKPLKGHLQNFVLCGWLVGLCACVRVCAHPASPLKLVCRAFICSILQIVAFCVTN